MSTNFSMKNDQHTTNVDNADTLRTNTLMATNIVGLGDTNTINSTTINNTGTTTTDTLDSTTLNNTGTATVNDLVATSTIRAPAGAPADVGFGQAVSNSITSGSPPIADFADNPAFTQSGTPVVLSEGDWKLTFTTGVTSQTAGATAQRTVYTMGFTSDGTRIPSNGVVSLMLFNDQVDNPPVSGGVMSIDIDHYFFLTVRIPAGETRTIDAWGSKLPPSNEVPLVRFQTRALFAEKIRTITGSVETL